MCLAGARGSQPSRRGGDEWNSPTQHERHGGQKVVERHRPTVIARGRAATSGNYGVGPGLVRMRRGANASTVTPMDDATTARHTAYLPGGIRASKLSVADRLRRMGDPAPRSPESTTTIVIADDHAVVRSGLRMLLDSGAGLRGRGGGRPMSNGARPLRARATAPDGPDPRPEHARRTEPFDAIPHAAVRSSPQHADRRADHAGRSGLRARGDAGGSARVCAEGGRRHRAGRGRPRCRRAAPTYLHPRLGARLAAEAVKARHGRLDRT